MFGPMSGYIASHAKGLRSAGLAVAAVLAVSNCGGGTATGRASSNSTTLPRISTVSATNARTVVAAPGTTVASAPDPPPPVAVGEVWSLLRQADSLVTRAVAIETNRCMLLAGFSFPIPSPSGSEQIPTVEVWEYPNQDDGTADGYVNLAVLTSSEQPVEVDVSASYQAVLNGKVVGEWSADPNKDLLPGAPSSGEIYDGCFPSSLTHVVGDGHPDRAFDLDVLSGVLQQIRIDATAQVFASSEWQAAEAEWRSCMSEAGYSYSTITEPIGTSWPQPRPGRLEKTTATADWECKKSLTIPDLGATLLEREYAAAGLASEVELGEISQQLKVIAERATRSIEDG
jgi:hypothetical protein